MKKITEEKAIEIFELGGEVWVFTGDYGEFPIFFYEEDEDGNEIMLDENRLMHPKSKEHGDVLDDFFYNNYYIATSKKED